MRKPTSNFAVRVSWVLLFLALVIGLLILGRLTSDAGATGINCAESGCTMTPRPTRETKTPRPGRTRTATPSPSPTISPTATATRTPSATPTLPVCPTAPPGLPTAVPTDCITPTPTATPTPWAYYLPLVAYIDTDPDCFNPNCVPYRNQD